MSGRSSGAGFFIHQNCGGLVSISVSIIRGVDERSFCNYCVDSVTVCLAVLTTPNTNNKRGGMNGNVVMSKINIGNKLGRFTLKRFVFVAFIYLA